MFHRFAPLRPFTALIACLVAVSACASATSSGTNSAKKSPPPATSPSATVATIDGKPITMADLDERASRQLFDIRHQALEQLLNDELMDREAKAQGITKEALLTKEVTSKVTEPTAAEIDQVWEANKARLPGKTKEQVTPDIVNFLKSQKAPTLQQNFMQTLRTKYKVQIMLEPPRVVVSVDDDPAKGPAGAPVTIIEFSDFQCPFCGRVETTLKTVLDKYKDKVRFVYRDFPLSIHPLAPKAAEAAECAHDQGKFWEFHDALYADQSKLSVPDMEATAAGLGLNADKFKSCLESGKFASEVSKDVDDANKAGVSSTPSFFINGIPLVGAQGDQAFAEIIDRELAKAGK
jgi:protein-disulfide isomerase